MVRKKQMEIACVLFEMGLSDDIIHEITNVEKEELLKYQKEESIKRHK